MIEPYKFTDEKKAEYIRLLSEGGRRHASAKAVGVTPPTVNAHMKDSPDFAMAVANAEIEANEIVENALFTQATKGNVTAIQVWLYNRANDRWVDKRHSEQKITGELGVRIIDDIPPPKDE